MLKKILSVKVLLWCVFLGFVFSIIGSLVESIWVGLVGAIFVALYCILVWIRIIFIESKKNKFKKKTKSKINNF